MKKWIIRISRPVDDPLLDALKIYIGYRDNNGDMFIGLPIVFNKLKEGSYIDDATLTIPGGDDVGQFLRKLATELKQNGLELNLEVEGELKATKVHLEDMRSLVFNDKKGGSNG